MYQDYQYALWHTVAYTGLRRSEALALRWGDIDLAGARLSLRRAADTTQRDTVNSPKSGHARAVDIDSETVSILRA